MKVLVKNMRDLPFVFEIDADDGSVVRELLAGKDQPGDTVDIGTRLSPWELNRPNLARRLVSPGGQASITPIAGGYRVSANGGQVTVTFVREPDDLVFLFTALDIIPTHFARLATTADLGWTASGVGPGKTLTSPTPALSNNDVDGVTSVVGDIILVRSQSTSADNGLYVVVQTADGALTPAIWMRAVDFDTGAEAVAGTLVIVTEGDTLADTGWILATNNPITVDSSPLIFIRTFAPGGVTAAEHQTLRQLIHFIDEGPASGFVSGAYKEILGGVFPTSVTWWTSAAKTQKIVEKLVTRSGGGATNVAPTPVVWNMYAPGPGVGTLVGSISDAVTYNGAFELSRVRTVAL